MVNVVTIAAYGQIYWLGLIGLVQRLAATWRCVLHSSNEPGELSLWQYHNDITLNIVVAITITICLSSCDIISDITYTCACRPASFE